ncbi:dTDP-4-dehydrorhamnose 3,5-epimerase family protein [Undibacterium curvum]|uniref:dTDP-4-dehydrorhamnose 3,5-epimerase n=1 Tax=Undibacterium curvum TaxID=2762294 RepID=A0ABR7A7B8_9BURK|nr:dTDP-4-dehydrorhamnose 3,5-epimerase [Undibacterium curvum]MBC3932713.1 dTDP-4-dehydrorhamnose 3,5-epimerase family protein [Undibacterium curvum]
MAQRFELIETPLRDLHLIQRLPLGDERGYFQRLFCAEELALFGWREPVQQINHTYTKEKGSVRGLHMQLAPHAEAKLITCLRGEVWDVAVDLRLGSSTFLHWHAVHLIAEKACSYLIPEGFAHGFQTLSDDVEMLYCHSQAYAPDSEFGIHVQDPRLQIHWPLPIGRQSERDQQFPFLDQHFQGVGR